MVVNKKIIKKTIIQIIWCVIWTAAETKSLNRGINQEERGRCEHTHTHSLCVVMLQHNVHYSVWFLEGFAISEAFKISLVVRCIICFPSNPWKTLTSERFPTGTFRWFSPPSVWGSPPVADGGERQQLDSGTAQSQRVRCSGGKCTLPSVGQLGTSQLKPTLKG